MSNFVAAIWIVFRSQRHIFLKSYWFRMMRTLDGINQFQASSKRRDVWMRLCVLRYSASKLWLSSRASARNECFIVKLASIMARLSTFLRSLGRSFDSLSWKPACVLHPFPRRAKDELGACHPSQKDWQGEWESGSSIIDNYRLPYASEIRVLLKLSLPLPSPHLVCQNEDKRSGGMNAAVSTFQ